MEDPKNNNKENEKIQEEKPLETFKDNIKNENISDINIKNQSVHNNENEEIKMLINNEAKKEGQKIVTGYKKKEEEIIKRANKIPELEPNYEFRINDTMKKIKNKSLEKKMKDLFDSGKKTNNEIKKNNQENNFIDKLKDIELKFEKIDEYKRNKNNNFEFTLRNNNEEKNNRYDSYNKTKEEKKISNSQNNFFDFNYKKDKRENKYKDLNKFYFSADKFEFFNKPLNENKKKYQMMNYTKEMKKLYSKYNAQRLRRMNKIIKKPDFPDNFKNIFFTIKKFQENKKGINLTRNNLFNNNLAQSEMKTMRTTKYDTKTNFNNFKTISVEKPSKLKNILEDIYSEINKANNNNSTRTNFDQKISNIKFKMNSSQKNNMKIIKSNNTIGKNKLFKSSFSNLDDLLKLCSKRNLKKYINN